MHFAGTADAFRRARNISAMRCRIISTTLLTDMLRQIFYPHHKSFLSLRFGFIRLCMSRSARTKQFSRIAFVDFVGVRDEFPSRRDTAAATKPIGIAGHANRMSCQA